jgi:hypothetical protein
MDLPSSSLSRPSYRSASSAELGGETDPEADTTAAATAEGECEVAGETGFNAPVADPAGLDETGANDQPDQELEAIAAPAFADVSSVAVAEEHAVALADTPAAVPAADVSAAAMADVSTVATADMPTVAVEDMGGVSVDYLSLEEAPGAAPGPGDHGPSDDGETAEMA